MSQLQINDNILLHLKQEIASCSPTLQKLGGFVLEHAPRVLYMTITELARESKTSEASITRLCRQLRCKGFSEFKMALALDVQQSAPAGAVPNDADMLDIQIEECVTALRDTGKLLDRQALRNGAGFLHRAESAHIFGIAASAIVGDYLNYKLLRLGKRTQIFTDAHCAAMNTVSLSARNVTIAISSSGSTKDVIYVAEQAKKRGCPLIVLSNTSRSPLADLADTLLVAAKPEGPLTAGALNSKVGAMLLVELLILELMKCDARYATVSQETAGVTLPMLL